LVVILFCFSVTFPCLTASYFYGAADKVGISNNRRIVGAAFSFVASMTAWYLVSLLVSDEDLSMTKC